MFEYFLQYQNFILWDVSVISSQDCEKFEQRLDSIITSKIAGKYAKIEQMTINHLITAMKETISVIE